MNPTKSEIARRYLVVRQQNHLLLEDLARICQASTLLDATLIAHRAWSLAHGPVENNPAADQRLPDDWKWVGTRADPAGRAFLVANPPRDSGAYLHILSGYVTKEAAELIEQAPWLRAEVKRLTAALALAESKP